jgi:hypothetical protein
MALNVLEKSLNLTLPDMYEPWINFKIVQNMTSYERIYVSKLQRLNHRYLIYTR